MLATTVLLVALVAGTAAVGVVLLVWARPTLLNAATGVLLLAVAVSQGCRMPRYWREDRAMLERLRKL